MKPKLFISTIILLFIACCKEPAKKEALFFNKQFNWEIRLPENFTNVPEAEWVKRQGKGIQLAEDTFNEQARQRAVYICFFVQDQYNYLEANYNIYNFQYYTSYSAAFRSSSEAMYTLIQKNVKQAAIDTSFSSVTVGRLKFHTFELAIQLPDKRQATVKRYSHIFGDKEFNVLIMSTDSTKRQLLEDCFLRSNFK